MTAYLYTWDVEARQWCFNDILPTEEAAKTKGRLLWKSGVSGIKIDVLQTVVEQKRNP